MVSDQFGQKAETLILFNSVLYLLINLIIIIIIIIYFYNKYIFFQDLSAYQHFNSYWITFTVHLFMLISIILFFFQGTKLHEKILKLKVLACDDMEPFCA